MKTWSLSSKKCLTASFLFFSLSTLALASTGTGTGKLAAQLRKEIIQTPTDASFDPLLHRWRQNYGTAAVTPLLQLASQTQLADHQRYMALMGAAQLGGPAISEKIIPMLKDSSWMIRCGALRALAALFSSSTPTELKGSEEILPLLRDPALVVRMEAVQTVELMKPIGAEEALVSILNRPENYHHQLSQWVPERALTALETLGSHHSIAQIRPLLDHNQDPKLQKAALKTLEALSGKSVMESLKDQPLAEQIRYWKKIALQ